MMKIIKIILLVILVVIIGAGVYAGIAYSKMKKGAQKDLGVKYSFEDYTKAISGKTGVEVVNPEKLYFGSNFTAEGSNSINQSFTDAEVSAIQNYSNEKKGPFKNVQIKFLGNDQIESSAFITDSRVNSPVYAKGIVKQTGSKSVSLDLQELEVGSFNIPAALKNRINNEFVKYVNDILASINGLNVEKIVINNGSAQFIGTVPAKVTAN